MAMAVRRRAGTSRDDRASVTIAKTLLRESASPIKPDYLGSLLEGGVLSRVTHPGVTERG